MRRPYLVITLCFSITLVSMFGCNTTPNYWVDAKPNQKKILVSFPPLYAITHAVAGEDAYVLCMLTSRGPHGYEGAPTDLFMVKNADLFIHNGLELDDLFVEKMLANHSNRSLATLNLGVVLNKNHHELLLHGEHGHADDKDGAHAGHKHGEHDPHLWLGPPQAIQMTKIIAARLGELDPAKKKGYDERAEKFIDELKKLQAHGDAAFKDKKNKKLITMHEAFAYFADAYKLEIVESIQKRPGLDPDAASIARLIKLCKAADGPRVIAVEPQYSPAQAESLKAALKRDGVEVEIVNLDPLETEDKASNQKFNPDPAYYLKKMRVNIDTLAKALK